MKLAVEIEVADDIAAAVVIDRIDLAPPYENPAVESAILEFVAKNLLSLLVDGHAKCISFRKVDGRPTRRERAVILRQAEPEPLPQGEAAPEKKTPKRG